MYHSLIVHSFNLLYSYYTHLEHEVIIMNHATVNVPHLSDMKCAHNYGEVWTPPGQGVIYTHSSCQFPMETLVDTEYTEQ